MIDEQLLRNNCRIPDDVPFPQVPDALTEEDSLFPFLTLVRRMENYLFHPRHGGFHGQWPQNSIDVAVPVLGDSRMAEIPPWFWCRVGLSTWMGGDLPVEFLEKMRRERDGVYGGTLDVCLSAHLQHRYFPMHDGKHLALPGLVKSGDPGTIVQLFRNHRSDLYWTWRDASLPTTRNADCTRTECVLVFRYVT